MKRSFSMLSSNRPSAQIIRRVNKELKSLRKNPIDGVAVNPNEDDLTVLHAKISGPAETPFEGGTFVIRLRLGRDFPHAPPKAEFLTKVFHPNVEPDSGQICVNTLKRDWKPENDLRHILMVIKCLLIFPNPESALNEEAGRLCNSDYAGYCKKAR